MCGRPWFPEQAGFYLFGARSTAGLITHRQIGLPDLPYFTGAPVFQPLSPVSRQEAARETQSPVFHYQYHAVTIIDVPNILNQLRQNLNSRVQQKFFGAEATKKLKLLDANKHALIESELLIVYERILLYITVLKGLIFLTRTF